MRDHGGTDEHELRELGLSPGEVLDFSVNVNPYGPSVAMVRAIREAAIDRYPDPRARRAREALALACGVDVTEVIVGSGAADLLWTIARSLLRPGATGLVVEPAFSEFRAAAAFAEARVLEWRASARDGFRIDGGAIANLAREAGADVLYLCAPSNPTGASFSARALAALAGAVAESIVVVDQSFLSLSDDHADLAVRLPANVVCVRSLTKDHAIPGVRLGYAVASPNVVERLERSRAAWSISSAAAAAAIVAAGSQDFVAECRAKLAVDRERLAAALRSLALDPVPSVAPFLLVEVGRARELRRRLLARHAILVRDCGSFGLPGFIRLAARPALEVDRLVTALAKEVES